MSERTIFVRHGVTGQIWSVYATDLPNLQAQHSAWDEITADEAAADARFIRNAGGTVHSIPSIALADALAVEGTVQIDEATARESAPELFGPTS